MALDLRLVNEQGVGAVKKFGPSAFKVLAVVGFIVGQVAIYRIQKPQDHILIFIILYALAFLLVAAGVYIFGAYGVVRDNWNSEQLRSRTELDIDECVRQTDRLRQLRSKNLISEVDFQTKSRELRDEISRLLSLSGSPFPSDHQTERHLLRSGDGERSPPHGDREYAGKQRTFSTNIERNSERTYSEIAGETPLSPESVPLAAKGELTEPSVLFPDPEGARHSAKNEAFDDLFSERSKSSNSTASLARVTKTLYVFLIVGAVAHFLAIIAGLYQISVISWLQQGAYASESEARMDILSSDSIRSQVDGFVALAFLASVIAFCVWIYRANKNVRELGAIGMKYSPGWAVGWFFIPFANLFEPYRAMSELWRASQSTSSWKNVKAGQILPIWWASFLIPGFIGMIAFQVGSSPQATLNGIFGSVVLFIVRDALNFGANLIAFLLVKDVFDGQLRQSRQLL